MRSILEAILELIDFEMNQAAVVATFGPTELVDHWDDQFENLDMKVIPRNAVFVELREGIWSQGGGGIQFGDWVVGVHIGNKSMADTYTGAINRAEALLHWDYVCKVHEILQGFDGPGFNGLNRVLQEKEEKVGQIRRQLMDYITNITDATHVDENQLEEAEVDTLEVIHDPLLNTDPGPPAQEPNGFLPVKIIDC